MIYEIKNKHGNVIFSCEAASSKEALQQANLSRANLSGANLSGDNLSGANLYRANLSGANLSGADLSRANLYRADLSRANLYEANLYEANLSRANLSGSNLYEANLSGANLSGAVGANKYLSTPLYLLLEQPGPIRAYKLVTAEGEGPYNGGIIYEVGNSYEVHDADSDEKNACGAGINLASLDWCMKEWRDGYRILVAEFTADDIASIPIGSDGKFRVHRCLIIGEKDFLYKGEEGRCELS